MHAEVVNKTGFALATTFALDEESRPLCVAILKATFSIVNGRDVVLAERQAEPSIAGELFGDDAETSSYKLEPDIAFVKPGVDCVLVGHAYAPRADATHVDVAFRVGAVEKAIRVFGDRVWVRAMGQTSPSRPQRFDKIALRYENAFGGKDPASRDPERALVDLRNPVGRGFHAPDSKFEEGCMLPNLEDLRAPIAAWDHAPPPASFGFVSPGWSPRRELAGTYDAAWIKQRMPRLPTNFDRRYFNAASAGLVAPALRGDEHVQIVGAALQGVASFQLPRVAPPKCSFSIRRRPASEATMALDTVVVDTDAATLSLTFRAHAALSNGPHDLAAIAVA